MCRNANALVEVTLTSCEIDWPYNLSLGWQLGGDLLFVAAQDVRLHQFSKLFEALVLAFALDWVTVLCAKATNVAQQARHGEIKERPKLF